ncbi:PREDICTED: farnesyl pyrophosphate synthase 2-like [Papilio polytes]|uniref:farnesyl pyrophosphate synthase 2-like n=1 Tax=Papilio polytes TaxID=76194 RepID=UPI000675C03E|nr:PREDICTED: farnesyl pyrophosphate synthase 2-like [Papilio polytes]
MLLSRCFVRGFRIWHSAAVQQKQTSKADWLERTQRFNNTVQKIVSDVIANGEVGKTPSLAKRLTKLMEYDTLLRIPLQGHMTMMAYEVLENPKNLNEQNLYKAQVVSCAMELTQSYFLVMDDFEDQSKTRHGQPCWHLLPEVNNLIVNDVCIFRSLIDDILKAHFQGSVYTKMVDIFNKMNLFIAIGQHLDTMIPKAKDYSLFTQENYNKIIRYKCTYYCLEVPIMLALILCEKDTEETFQRVTHIVRDVGALYQMMNDFTEFCDEESISDKTDTDIQAGKCSYFAVKAMERANAEQKEIFKASYGSWDPEDVRRIKKLYKDLDLITLYKEQHKFKYNQFLNNVNELQSDDVLTPELFTKLMEASHLNNWNIY